MGGGCVGWVESEREREASETGLTRGRRVHVMTGRGGVVGLDGGGGCGNSRC